MDMYTCWTQIKEQDSLRNIYLHIAAASVFAILGQVGRDCSRGVADSMVILNYFIETKS